MSYKLKVNMFESLATHGPIVRIGAIVLYYFFLDLLVLSFLCFDAFFVVPKKIKSEFL